MARRLAWWSFQALLWGALLAFLALLAFPRVSHFDILIVRGGSMEPAIARGGIAVIDTTARTLEPGDIAAFHDPLGILVTHRVVELRDSGLVTRGDANDDNDPLVRRPEDVAGKVTFSAPYVGYALYVLEQPYVFLVLLGATGGYVVLNELGVIWRELRKMREQRSEAS